VGTGDSAAANATPKSDERHFRLQAGSFTGTGRRHLMRDTYGPRETSVTRWRVRLGVTGCRGAARHGVAPVLSRPRCRTADDGAPPRNSGLTRGYARALLNPRVSQFPHRRIRLRRHQARGIVVRRASARFVARWHASTSPRPTSHSTGGFGRFLAVMAHRRHLFLPRARRRDTDFSGIQAPVLIGTPVTSSAPFACS
jgi:hypothetical protein